jgi:soluble lytic murein transglycosylase
MALSYEALGDFESALAQWELYAATEPAIAALEQAKILARIGETETAVAAYTEFIETYPEKEQAPFASWSLAQLSEQLGDVATAVDLYVSLADNTPDNANAAEALVIAGQLNYDNEAPEAALILWQRAATEYPDSDFGAAAMVRLLRLLPEEQNELRATIQALAKANTTTGYAGWRARDLANDFPPFFSLPPFEQPENEVAAYQEVEAWLETELELDKGTVLSEFGPELQNDPRLIIGEQLWNLGLMSDAQLEFNDLRANYAADAVASYQLALYLHDLGLYRSAIGAAETVLRLTGQSVLEAPPLIGRLAYPIPFADLIVPLAEEYDYDPRLQWALIRQESLFDTIARSSAAAQGLSQVIPDTGAWIAQRLQWPDYENDDLYKPHVGLTFGAYYLSQQLSDFDNTVHAALSAYNAGPGNAYRWYETAVDDIDLYVATVDFPETRTYIERIYAGYDIYRYLYVSSNGG